MRDYLERVNSGPGRPLVFIPGFLETGSLWAPLIARLEPFLPDCYTLPLPGHPPWSGPRAQPLSDNWINAYADTLADLLPGGARLVGHSTGGLVALELAQARPDLVQDVFLIGALHAGDVGGHKTATHAMAESETWGPFLLSATLKAWLLSERGFEAGLTSVMAQKPDGLDLPRTMRDDLATADPRMLHALLQWMARRDGRALPQVSCPVTSVIGTQDRVIAPIHQVETVKTVPWSTAVLLRTGHLPFLERPDLFDPAFRAWLAAPKPAGSRLAPDHACC